MRVPIRKPGKYTHLKPDPHMTEAKRDELTRELEHLKKIQPAAAAEVRRLAELGDLSENAAYQIAKGRLRGILNRIDELDERIKKAIIITPGGSDDVVQIGCRVTIRLGDRDITYLILGSAETDPSRNIISHLSPVGSALMGRRVGETVSLPTGVSCTIITVNQ